MGKCFTRKRGDGVPPHWSGSSSNSALVLAKRSSLDSSLSSRMPCGARRQLGGVVGVRLQLVEEPVAPRTDRVEQSELRGGLVRGGNHDRSG